MTADRTLEDDLWALYAEPTGRFHHLIAAAGLDQKADFRDRDLREMRFAGADLRGFDFSKSNLQGTSVRLAKYIDKTTILDGAELDSQDREWLAAHSRLIGRKQGDLLRGRALLDELCAPGQATPDDEDNLVRIHGLSVEDLRVLIAALRARLKERTRERVPLDWARTQSNLGNALWRLGERESGTARLEEAVAAFHAALTERTRERVPLDWAMTQNNLGNALGTLGGRESGTARLEEAVAACREALTERTRERVPLDWAMTQNNLGTALQTLGERESGTARLDEAVVAYREALKEQTSERVPLQWAGTQYNLGIALGTLGERESGTARLDEAVVAWNDCLAVVESSGPQAWVQTVRAQIDQALAEIARRTPKELFNGGVAAARAKVRKWAATLRRSVVGWVSPTNASPQPPGQPKD